MHRGQVASPLLGVMLYGFEVDGVLVPFGGHTPHCAGADNTATSTGTRAQIRQKLPSVSLTLSAHGMPWEGAGRSDLPASVSDYQQLTAFAFPHEAEIIDLEVVPLIARVSPSPQAFLVIKTTPAVCARRKTPTSGNAKGASS